MSFSLRPKRQKPTGLVIASGDPIEFAKQVEDALKEANGSGSIENETNASLLHELVQDIAREKALSESLKTSTPGIVKPTDQQKETLGFKVITKKSKE